MCNEERLNERYYYDIVIDMEILCIAANLEYCVALQCNISSIWYT